MKETKNVRMYKRYMVLLRHFEGYSNVEIAKMVCLEQHAVGDYITSYNNRSYFNKILISDIKMFCIELLGRLSIEILRK